MLRETSSKDAGRSVIYVDVTGPWRESGKSSTAVFIYRALARLGVKVELRGTTAARTKQLRQQAAAPPVYIPKSTVLIRDEGTPRLREQLEAIQTKLDNAYDGLWDVTDSPQHVEALEQARAKLASLIDLLSDRP